MANAQCEGSGWVGIFVLWLVKYLLETQVLTFGVIAAGDTRGCVQLGEGCSVGLEAWVAKENSDLGVLAGGHRAASALTTPLALRAAGVFVNASGLLSSCVQDRVP